MDDKKNKDQSATEDNGTDQIMEQEKEHRTAEEQKAENREVPLETEGQADAGTALQERMEALKQDNMELKDKYLRLFAEFDNYKKRTIREKIELMNTAAGDTMAALLPVLDDFDRAKKIAEDENTMETFSDGVRLVYHKLYQILKQKGLEPMETNGELFDPELHEAFTEMPAPSDEMKGRIIDTIERGYKLKDKIIRHAKVVVGK